MAADEKNGRVRIFEGSKIVCPYSNRFDISDAAFQNFFRQPKAGFPKFKSKKRNKNSYSTVCINSNITIGNGYLKLPENRTSPIKTAQIYSKGIQTEIGDSKPDTWRKLLCKYSF